MQTFIQNWEKLPSKNYVYLSAGLSLFLALTVLVARNYLPPEVPLFYGKPVGEEQLVPNLGLLIVPGILLLTVITNTVLSVVTNEPFLKKTLIFSALFVTIIAAITIFKIIFLVGFF